MLVVTTRLVDDLGDARIDVPSLAAAQPYLQPYWRKMRAPWARLSGTPAHLGLTLALRTSRGTESQFAVPVQGGDTWVPQARIWNMNEGSFDQRECISAPTPASITFRIAVPARARLRFSPAVLSPVPRTTVFDVAIVDAGGVEHGLSTTRVAGADARRWLDVEADLAPWAGQRVELRLETRAGEPAPGEPRGAPVADEAAPDGGAAEIAPMPPMSLALWGDPVIVAEAPARVPYDVLWIVVDALRPDVAASLHDPAEDRAKLAAPLPPLDALLPAIPGLMPSVDRLARRGVRFLHAWSAATWTRAGTLAMLAGERSSEAGVDPTLWVVPAEAASRYYASDPPLVPLLLRRRGVSTAAFVNNFFMAGYASVGVDMGPERVTDHRYRTRDTDAIEHDALAWLDAHARDRFFLFVNFNSPHEPYDPPPEMLARVPPPPEGPRDPRVRAYMGEAAKDDAAIGALLDRLDALGLTRSTLVVVTSDHGETLSEAHDAEGMEHMHMRFHHAAGNFEETARIPMVMALPGVIDGGRAIEARVRSVDIAPTVLDVEGIEADPRQSGRSLLPLARGASEADPRPVAGEGPRDDGGVAGQGPRDDSRIVTEGRGSRALLWGRWRLVVHDGGGEDALYDLRDDPGERRDVAHAHPDEVAEMRARLAAVTAGLRAADARGGDESAVPVVHLRFAGAGRARRVSGSIRVGDGKHGATFSVDPVGIAPGAVRVDGPSASFALTTTPDGLVGLDLRVDPPGVPVAWTLFLDDAPWPEGATFAGPFGLPAVAARGGIATDDARAEACAPSLPFVDPARDLGLFVTRDRPGDGAAAGATAPEQSAAAAEMQQVLRQWGYARGPSH